jgi:hypothetical protein
MSGGTTRESTEKAAVVWLVVEARCEQLVMMVVMSDADLAVAPCACANGQK